MPWRSYSRQRQQANSSEIILSKCSWSGLSSLIYDSWLDRTSQSRPLFSIGPSPFFVRPSANGPILVGQFITPSYHGNIKHPTHIGVDLGPQVWDRVTDPYASGMLYILLIENTVSLLNKF